jgi:hypothetical protein
MTTPLRDALTQRINQVGPAHPNVEELIGLGERRLRRRWLTAAAGTGAAVALAIALVVGGTAWNRSADHQEGPIDRPVTPDQTQITTPKPSRPIIYSDVKVLGGGRVSGASIHVGDRLVDTDSGWINTDVTDAGVVYIAGGHTFDGRVWFTDGGKPVQIGSHACVAQHGAGNTVVTGISGSLAAWFDCTRAEEPELVVYDTGSGREVVRELVTQCREVLARSDIAQRLGSCNVDAVIGDHIYFTHWMYHGQAFQFDMATERVTRVDPATNLGDNLFPFSYDVEPQAYLDDIRSQPRGLVLGDSWETGKPDPFGVFRVVGKMLVAQPGIRAYDTATHDPVRFRLPNGYRGAVEFDVFEWLNDDTVALIGPSGWGDMHPGAQTDPGYGDVLTCRLSDGHCDLTARGHGPVRLAGNTTVPR